MFSKKQIIILKTTRFSTDLLETPMEEFERVSRPLVVGGDRGSGSRFGHQETSSQRLAVPCLYRVGCKRIAFQETVSLTRPHCISFWVLYIA